MEKIPPFSEDLIKELDQMYPEKCPEPGQTDREIWMAVGARRLVRALVVKLKSGELDILHQTNVMEKKKKE